MKDIYTPPPSLRWQPNQIAPPEFWKNYEKRIAERMRERIIDEIPPCPVSVMPTAQQMASYHVPEKLRRIPFRRLPFIDPITGRSGFQITFPDGWGDDEHFHAMAPYYYISPWNTAPVKDDSWLAVIALNERCPDGGSRIYVIRHDGQEARCLMDHCRFTVDTVEGRPYVHAPAFGWLDAETLYVSQTDGIACRISVSTGEIEPLPNLPRHREGFPSPNGKYLACSPIPFGYIKHHTGHVFIYDFDKKDGRMVMTLHNLVRLHPELPRDRFEMTWYCANFCWSPDSQVLTFFAMLYCNGRVIRDLCRINADGTGLGIVLSSEDMNRYSVSGSPGKFGHLMASGVILHNHHSFLPNGKQLFLCTPDPYLQEIEASSDPAWSSAKLQAFVNLDGSDLTLIRNRMDPDFDGHPSCNVQGTWMLGSDYSHFIKAMRMKDGYSTNLFSLKTIPSAQGHPHECWSPDGKFIIFRHGKESELFTASFDVPTVE